MDTNSDELGPQNDVDTADTDAAVQTTVYVIPRNDEIHPEEEEEEEALMMMSGGAVDVSISPTPNVR